MTDLRNIFLGMSIKNKREKQKQQQKQKGEAERKNICLKICNTIFIVFPRYSDLFTDFYTNSDFPE